MREVEEKEAQCLSLKVCQHFKLNEDELTKETGKVNDRQRHVKTQVNQVWKGESDQLCQVLLMIRQDDKIIGSGNMEVWGHW